MLVKTHLIIALTLVLIIMPFIDDKLLFSFVLIISSLIPDIDTKESYLGKNTFFRPLQFFIKHRSIMHSLAFGICISIIIYLVFPIVSYGFFIGFMSHIFADSLTKEGVFILWPYKKRFNGMIKTGGYIEKIIFLSLVIFDALILSFHLLVIN